MTELGDLKGLIGEMTGDMRGLRDVIQGLSRRLDVDAERAIKVSEELHARIKRHREDWEADLREHVEKSRREQLEADNLRAVQLAEIRVAIAALEMTAGKASARWGTLVIVGSATIAVCTIALGVLALVLK